MSAQAQIHEGKEPAQFFSILHRLIISKVYGQYNLIFKLCLALKRVTCSKFFIFVLVRGETVQGIGTL